MTVSGEDSSDLDRGVVQRDFEVGSRVADKLLDLPLHLLQIVRLVFAQHLHKGNAQRIHAVLEHHVQIHV